MGTLLANTPMVSDNIFLYAGLLNSDGTIPAKFTITVDGAVTAGANTITVQTLGGEVRKGSFIPFTDASTGRLVVAYVTQDAPQGATTLSVSDGNDVSINGVAAGGVPFAIADTSTAAYPPELVDATDSSASNSPTTVSGQTYNSGGYQIITNTGNAFSISVPLFMYQYNNGAARTLELAADNLSSVALIKELPADLGYATGAQRLYKATLSYNEPSAAADLIKMEFTLSVQGAPIKIQPRI